MEHTGTYSVGLAGNVLFGLEGIRLPNYEKADSQTSPRFRCKFCAQQKEILGKQAFESNNVEYVECSEDGKNSQANTLCQEKDIQGYPSWEINGKVYSGQRSLEEMEVMVRMVDAISPGKDKAPPRILTTSSERALELSSQLKSLQSVLYGAYWDPHTFEQKEKLGKEAFSNYLSYVECGKDGDHSQLDLCKERKIQVVPTWEINKKLYPGDQELDELEEIIASSKVAKETAATLASAETVVSTPPQKSTSGTESTSKTKDSEPEKPAPLEITKLSTDKTLALAKQMESLNARMYGAYFCTHCYDQKQAFGIDAFSHISYVECTQDGKDSQLGICREKGIRSVPTWEINGKLFVGERSIDELQELVSAELTAVEQLDAVSVQQSSNAPPPIVATSSDQALTVASQMEKLDAKLYGAYWCRFTQAQKERFGKEAFAKIQYVECSPDGLNSASAVCRDKRIDGYPTWQVNGKMYPGDQELEELAIIVADNTKGD
jgi:glutaredoxin